MKQKPIKYKVLEFADGSPVTPDKDKSTHPDVVAKVAALKAKGKKKP